MSYFIVALIGGIKIGSIYALIAIGYSIVYSIMRLINFAHGELLMISTFCVWGFMEIGIPFWLSAILAVVITVFCGIGIERIAYRPVRNHGEATMVITSLAVSILLESVFQAIFGNSNKSLILPEVFSKRLYFADTSVSVMNIVILVVTVILIFAVSIILKKTRLGRAMRAVADNGEAANLVGIERNKIIVFAFAIGSALAAVAGIMYSGEYVSFNPSMGFMLGVKAFIAAVIGGLGSLSGAAIGGLLMGILEIFFAGYLPDGVTTYQTTLVFLVMIFILLVRPHGLLGSGEGKRS